jgi:signal transduction histidine kinase
MRRSDLTSLLAAVAALSIFIADTLTPPSVSVSTLYVISMMIMLRKRSTKHIVIAGIGSAVLTSISYALTAAIDKSQHAVMTNYYMSLFAIAFTAYLSIRIVVAEEAAAQIRDEIAKVSRGVSLSELTASIAHEINQPLAAIVANAGATKRWLSASPPNLAEAKQSVDAIVRNGERAGAVVNGLKRLISTTSAERRPFDLAHLVEETIDLMRAEIAKSRTHVLLSVGKRGLLLEGDRILLQQVIINIINNAAEALSETNPHQREIAIDIRQRDRASLLTFKDTGVGVDPKDVDKIFYAFYSTKENGMGIGLAICRSIVEAHGGELRAYPNEPRGMVFEIRIPLTVTD